MPTSPEPTPLRVEIEAEPLPAEVGPELRSALLSHPVVRSHFPGADLWLVSLDFPDKGRAEGDDQNLPFRAVLADMAGDAVIEAEGRLWELDAVDAWPTSRSRLPNDEEHAWAAELVLRDADLAARVEEGRAELYRPVPALANVQDPAGTLERAVTVGIREVPGDGGPATHRTVAVRTVDGDIIAISPPAAGEAGLAPAGPAAVAAGDSVADAHAVGPGGGQARVRVYRDEELLWDLVVVRPAASSGANGSGVELREVDYLGVRALQRGHVPIVNVAYADGRASRNWLNEEAPFEADAGEGESDAVAGFRVCPAPARTALDRGHGGGAFRGVALWVEGDEVVIASELQAGWHRYVSQWSLHADGTIKPRLLFAAMRNPQTGDPHTHHAYWRLDFDIISPEVNQVQEHNQPTLPGQLAPWHTVRWEVSRPRDPGHGREWRVRSVRSPHGYTIVPGPHDGVADEFGAGDFWVLAHHADELDDGQGATTDPHRARAQLDRFVTSELVEREDVVVWYAAHVPGTGEGGPAAGPDLTPFNWKRVERSAYVPLEPPPTLGPDEDDDEDDDDE
ncbi:MAG: hypothetical protein AB1673_10330 [Actinomycetota bacterium]|jgi:hypothetical protein